MKELHRTSGIRLSAIVKNTIRKLKTGTDSLCHKSAPTSTYEIMALLRKFLELRYVLLTPPKDCVYNSIVLFH